MALNNTYEARLVQQETALGAGAQLLLLALLGSVIGMGTAGWATGLVFALGTWALLSGACHRSGIRTFGPANRVTLGRAILVGGVTALVADSFESAPPVTLLVGLTAVALILDGVDGKVARRTNTSTPLGARFDMEVDAFLILVLSVYVSTQLGPWVLLMGAMRYVFVAAAYVWPWLNSALPHSMARKTVAATQGVCLLLAGSELLPYAANLAIAGTSLAALVWSFGRDVVWLFRTRPGAGKGVEEPVTVSVPQPRSAEPLSVEARVAAAEPVVVRPEPVVVISEPIVAALAAKETAVLAAR
ncbi:CDP-alcohol phosphatidyltransferase family protein [Streptomyces sp. 4F14]|uniref:CDP-alcohol phosphatidyltransferase family protein n=1 Tax=Streptomyces sp. 4F14 TaxID=3394380 RepID=UPI003A87F996